MFLLLMCIAPSEVIVFRINLLINLQISYNRSSTKRAIHFITEELLQELKLSFCHLGQTC